MKYGTFDDQHREYVITRPDTPAPWANYLGSPEYGALISNNAGGYSFAKSGANGRILRYVFNSSTSRDATSISGTMKRGITGLRRGSRVGKPLDAYRSECRHGMGYTVLKADYAGIHSEASYYVPVGACYEVWALTVRNDGDTPRSLTLTGFAEFTNVGNYENDQVNLQYSQFITRTKFHDNRIIQQIHGNLDAMSEEVDKKQVTERFFALSGSPVSSYCGEKKAFLGAYRQYGNPVGVERGDLGNVLNYNENCCGALSTVITLAPGESRSIAFLLGEQSDADAEVIAARYENPQACCERDLNALRSLWEERFSALKVKTPCPEFDTMINTWNAYNCFMTFIWSRAASFTYCGLRMAMATAIPCRTFRASFTCGRKWRRRSCGSCCLRRWTTAEDCRWSSSRTMQGTRIRRTTPPMSRKRVIRPTARTTRSGFSRRSTNTSRRRAMWTSSRRRFPLPTGAKGRSMST